MSARRSRSVSLFVSFSLCGRALEDLSLPFERLFLQQAPAIATDGKRRVVFLNLAAKRLLGVSRKDVLGFELSSVLSRSAVLKIPGIVPHAERAVYILDPATERTITCSLSKREHEIVELITEGYSALNIAARLNLSHATVRNHIQNALRKLEVHSQVEIVALALRRGWGRGGRVEIEKDDARLTGLRCGETLGGPIAFDLVPFLRLRRFGACRVEGLLARSGDSIDAVYERVRWQPLLPLRPGVS